MRKVTRVQSRRLPSRKKAARRCWSCTSFIPRRKLSTPPAPGRRMRWERRSSSWTSFSSPWARAWEGYEGVDLGTSTWQEIVALADVVLGAFWLETTLQERKSGRSPRVRGAGGDLANWKPGTLGSARRRKPTPVLAKASTV